MAAPGFYDDRSAAQKAADEHQSLMWKVGELMQRAERAEELLRDAAAALNDLGACDVADCDEPNFSRILQRIHVALNAEEATDA